MKRTISYFLTITVLLSACASTAASTPEQATPKPATPAPVATKSTVTEATMSFALTSSAFTQGQPIPEKHTCRGINKDISPALSWGEPPADTQSFALIMDDPDAPGNTWDHWILFDIPATARALPEAFPANETLPDGSISGKNSWGKTGYGGPCPPSGTHRYFFKLYALDIVTGLPAGASKGQLLKEMNGHILAQAELMGTFSK